MTRLRAPFVLVLVGLLLAAVGRAGDREERLDASHVKVGQLYRFRLAAGNSSVWEVVGKTDAEVRYKIKLTVAGKDLATGQDEVHSFALVRRPETREAPTGPRDLVRVSGVAFVCTILEASSAGTVVRTWRALQFPETIRVMLGTEVTAELVEIVAPK